MKTHTAHPFFSPASEELRFLSEGPTPLDPATWPGEDRLLAWVGIQHGETSTVGSVNLLNLETKENRSFPLPGRPGFVAQTNQAGVLLVGMERELVLLDLNTSPHKLIQTDLRAAPHSRTIINDGEATPFGVVFGTKDLHFKNPIAHLYLYRNGDKTLIPLRDGQVCSNGKVVLQDGDHWRLLDIDSPTKQVVAYELDAETGTLSAPTVIADFTHEPHFPDGMCLTPDGESLVIAFYNPNDVPYGIARQISLATGETEQKWHTPYAPRVTCPAFVEMEDGIYLLLTTAVEGMPAEQRNKHYESGTLFMAETTFQGPLTFAPKVLVDL